VTFESEGFAKPVIARFDQPDASSDGGLVLFKVLDTQLGLTRRLAACLDDGRAPGKVLHETIEVLQQRILGCARATPTATTPPGWSTTRSTS
jgi:hypothetical protein